MSDVQGTKLPRVIDQALREDIVRAYDICIRCEEELEEELKTGRDATKDLIDCRIVGYLFHHSPTNEALETVTNDVLSCANREDLLRLGRMYYDYLLKPFYFHVVEGVTILGKEDYEHPPSFVPLDAVSQKVMNTPTQDDATAHDKALVRDGFRCILTGAHDFRAMRRSTDLYKKFPGEGPMQWDLTKCAYIFKDKFDQGETSTNLYSILKRFGYKNLSAELNGVGFYRLENIINLGCKILSSFDEMCLWFAETSQPHTYQVKTGGSFKPLRASFRIPDYVTFTTPNKTKLPLPSPTYLKLHAAVCEIGELSGATDYMEQFCRGLDDLYMDLEEVAEEDDALSRTLRHF